MDSRFLQQRRISGAPREAGTVSSGLGQGRSGCLAVFPHRLVCSSESCVRVTVWRSALSGCEACSLIWAPHRGSHSVTRSARFRKNHYL